MTTYTIRPVASDEFGVVSGSGWAIFENGHRIDWPMLATEGEALSDLAGFRQAAHQLRSDETSEVHGLRRMNFNAETIVECERIQQEIDQADYDLSRQAPWVRRAVTFRCG